MTVVQPICRTCREPWKGGQIITSYGPRDADSVRHYCQPCLDNGKADAEEAKLREWDR